MSNARFYDLVNDKGRAFTAVFEPESDWGPSTVSFYDASQDPESFPYPGQFTGGRYCAQDIMDHRGGLILHGGVDVWRLSEMNVLDVKAWLLVM